MAPKILEIIDVPLMGTLIARAIIVQLDDKSPPAGNDWDQSIDWAQIRLYFGLPREEGKTTIHPDLNFRVTIVNKLINDDGWGTSYLDEHMIVAEDFKGFRSIYLDTNYETIQEALYWCRLRVQAETAVLRYAARRRELRLQKRQKALATRNNPATLETPKDAPKDDTSLRFSLLEIDK